MSTVISSSIIKIKNCCSKEMKDTAQLLQDEGSLGYVKSGTANSELTSKNGVLTQQLDFAIKTSFYCTM